MPSRSETIARRRCGSLVLWVLLSGCSVDSLHTPDLAAPTEMAAALAITDLSPKVWQSVGGVPLMLEGSGFTVDTQVTVGGLSAAPVTFLSPSRLAATLPVWAPQLPRQVDVVVTNPDGKQAWAPGKFTYSATTLAFPNPMPRVGVLPKAVVLADFDGDKRRDLIVANAGSHSLTLLHGDGQGGFNFGGELIAGLAPSALITGDYNLDGNADVVIANAGSNSLTVLLGDGRGSFSRQDLALGSGDSGPQALAAADLNSDGRIDLLVANVGSASVRTLLGQGGGAFTLGGSFGVSGGQLALATGDFNGDAKPDVAVTSSASSGLSVFLGQGNGAFVAAAASAVTLTNPAALAAAKLDANGTVDLAVANAGANNVTVLLGQGDGTFKAFASSSTGGTPSALILSDFSGDGKPDLIVANAGTNDVNLSIGKGDGSFTALRPTTSFTAFPVGANPLALAIGDLDGLNGPDLVAVNSGSGDISVLLHNILGSYYSLPTNLVVAQSPVGLDAVDLDGDGWQDLAVGHATPTLELVLMKSTPQLVTVKGCGGSPAFINPDGRKQLLLASDSRNLCVIDPLTLNFSQVGLIGTMLSAGIGDFDKDKLRDVAILTNSSNNLGLFRSDAAGNLTAAGFLNPRDTANGVVTGDWNEDGVEDLATSNSGNAIGLFMSDGRGGFLSAAQVPSGRLPIGLAVGDLNRDGHLDLAVANGLGDDVSVLLGAGQGEFRAARQFSVGKGPASVVMADFDGDKRLDLAVANRFSNSISVLVGDGHGGFAAARNFAAGYGVVLPIELPGVLVGRSLVAADLDGDSLPDLAVTNYGAIGVPPYVTGNSVTILKNQSR